MSSQTSVEMLYRCRLCTKYFKDRQYLESHVVRRHQQTASSGDDSCVMQEIGFPYNLRMGIRSRQNQEETQKVSGIKTKRRKVENVCQHGDKNDENDHQLAENAEDQSDFRQKCETCGTTFCSPSTLILHTKDHRGQETAVKRRRKRRTKYQSAVLTYRVRMRKAQPCPHCGKPYKVTASLMSHIFKQHLSSGNVDTSCQQKTLLVGTKTEVKTSSVVPTEIEERFSSQHDVVNTNYCTYEDISEKSDAVNCIAKEKVENISGNSDAVDIGNSKQICRTIGSRIAESAGRNFACHHCQKLFKTKSLLRVHSSVHTSIKRFKCHVCKKSFRTYNSIFVHRRVHSGERPYKCQFCTKSFSQRNSLMYHRSTHMKLTDNLYIARQNGVQHPSGPKKPVFLRVGKRSYKCEQCSRTFRSKMELDQHSSAIHRTERLLNCDKCDRRFIDSSLLKMHAVLHCADRPVTHEHLEATEELDRLSGSLTNSGSIEHEDNRGDQRPFSRNQNGLPHQKIHHPLANSSRQILCGGDDDGVNLRGSVADEYNLAVKGPADATDPGNNPSVRGNGKISSPSNYAIDSQKTCSLADVVACQNVEPDPANISINVRNSEECKAAAAKYFNVDSTAVRPGKTPDTYNCFRSHCDEYGPQNIGKNTSSRNIFDDLKDYGELQNNFNGRPQSSSESSDGNSEDNDTSQLGEIEWLNESDWALLTNMDWENMDLRFIDPGPEDELNLVDSSMCASSGCSDQIIDSVCMQLDRIAFIKAEVKDKSVATSDVLGHKDTATSEISSPVESITPEFINLENLLPVIVDAGIPVCSTLGDAGIAVEFRQQNIDVLAGHCMQLALNSSLEDVQPLQPASNINTTSDKFISIHKVDLMQKDSFDDDSDSTSDVPADLTTAAVVDSLPVSPFIYHETKQNVNSMDSTAVETSQNGVVDSSLCDGIQFSTVEVSSTSVLLSRSCQQMTSFVTASVVSSTTDVTHLDTVDCTFTDCVVGELIANHGDCGDCAVPVDDVMSVFSDAMSIKQEKSKALSDDVPVVSSISVKRVLQGNSGLTSSIGSSSGAAERDVVDHGRSSVTAGLMSEPSVKVHLEQTSEIVTTIDPFVSFEDSTSDHDTQSNTETDRVVSTQTALELTTVSTAVTASLLHLPQTDVTIGINTAPVNDNGEPLPVSSVTADNLQLIYADHDTDEHNVIHADHEHNMKPFPTFCGTAVCLQTNTESFTNELLPSTLSLEEVTGGGGTMPADNTMFSSMTDGIVPVQNGQAPASDISAQQQNSFNRLDSLNVITGPNTASLNSVSKSPTSTGVNSLTNANSIDSAANDQIKQELTSSATTSVGTLNLSQEDIVDNKDILRSPAASVGSTDTPSIATAAAGVSVTTATQLTAASLLTAGNLDGVNALSGMQPASSDPPKVSVTELNQTIAKTLVDTQQVLFSGLMMGLYCGLQQQQQQQHQQQQQQPFLQQNVTLSEQKESIQQQPQQSFSHQSATLPRHQSATLPRQPYSHHHRHHQQQQQQLASCTQCCLPSRQYCDYSQHPQPSCRHRQRMQCVYLYDVITVSDADSDNSDIEILDVFNETQQNSAESSTSTHITSTPLATSQQAAAPTYDVDFTTVIPGDVPVKSETHPPAAATHPMPTVSCCPHQQNAMHQCRFCGAKFLTVVALDRHAKQHVHQCRVCTKKFLSAYGLSVHMSKHKRCELCGKGLSNAAAAIKHAMMHMAVRRYKCKRCSKRFIWLANLRRHVDKKHQKKKVGKNADNYNCTNVAQRDDRPSLSNSSTVPEQNERTDVAQNTGKHSSVNTGVLTARSHSFITLAQIGNPGGINRPRPRSMSMVPVPVPSPVIEPSKGNKCTVCEKSFASPGYVKRHMSKHDPVPRFSCEHCNMQFGRLDALKRHIFSQHCDSEKSTVSSSNSKSEKKSQKAAATREIPETLHLCTTCKMQFSRWIDLYRHRQFGHRKSSGNDYVGKQKMTPAATPFSQSAKKSVQAAATDERWKPTRNQCWKPTRDLDWEPTRDLDWEPTRDWDWKPTRDWDWKPTRDQRWEPTRDRDWKLTRDQHLEPMRDLGEVPFGCGVCGDLFKTKEETLIHSKIHEKDL